MSTFYQTPAERELNARLLDKVWKFCTQIDGEYVRGEVRTIKCPKCNAERFDDGTHCASCGEYVTDHRPSPTRACAMHYCAPGEYAVPRATRFAYGYPVCDDLSCAMVAEVKRQAENKRKESAQ